MKTRIFIIVMLLLLYPTCIIATAPDHWRNLDRLADETLTLTSQGRYEDAARFLEMFGDHYLHLDVSERMKSHDSTRIVTVAQSDALEALQHVDLSEQEKLRAVTKFRLVIDAIGAEHQPLWSELESTVLDSFRAMENALTQKNHIQFETKLNEFLAAYETIHPSLQVDLDAERIQKLDSYIRFLDQNRSTLQTNEASTKIVTETEKELVAVFEQVTEDEADPSLIWVMISTGSVIILSLSYVGWKKYRADKQKRRSREDHTE